MIPSQSATARDNRLYTNTVRLVDLALVTFTQFGLGAVMASGPCSSWSSVMCRSR